MTSSPSLITASSLPPRGGASVSRRAVRPFRARLERPEVTKTGEFSIGTFAEFTPGTHSGGICRTGSLRRARRSTNIFRTFQREGVWEAIWEELRAALRERLGREASRSAGVIDSQSLQVGRKGGPDRFSFLYPSQVFAPLLLLLPRRDLSSNRMRSITGMNGSSFGFAGGFARM